MAFAPVRGRPAPVLAGAGKRVETHAMRAFVAALVLVAVALVLSPPGASGGACTPSRFAPRPSPSVLRSSWKCWNEFGALLSQT